MKSDLIALLQTLGYPVFLQGTVNPNAPYPDSFFTFWNSETPEAAFYDNDANRAVWAFWIFFYSTNPLLVETEPEKARKLLKQNGFILDGKANDVSVDRPTHTGAYFAVFKFENYNNEESEVLNNG